MAATEIKQKAYAFLETHRLAVLSTASSTGQPHGAAVFYVVDENLNMFFITQTDSRKHSYALAHKQVALTVADAETQTTMQIEGNARLVTNEEEVSMVMRELAKAPSKEIPHWPPPVSKLGDSFDIVKVAPIWMRIADFSKYSSDGTASYFEQILP